MTNLPTYSTLFSCLHDEPAPFGNFGRGTHYSILRSIEWLDVERKPLERPQIHDFAVIWDEDHDPRVIEVIEQFYMAGLLSPIQFIGERKGMLTVMLAAKFYFGQTEESYAHYVKQLDGLAETQGDTWPVEIGSFDRHDQTTDGHQTIMAGIVQDDSQAVLTYLKNIDYLWRLGTKNWHPPAVVETPWPPIGDMADASMG
jgi:hypothetical protein